MNSKKKPSKRIMAALLALLMLLTMGQTGLIGAFAAEGDFTVSVTDGVTAEPIEGASLTIVSATDSETQVVLEPDMVFQDSDDGAEDGNIAISEISEYFVTNPDTQISLSFTVSASDYQISEVQTVTVSSEDVTEPRTVSLQHDPSVTVSVTGAPEGTSVTAYLLANEEDTQGTLLTLPDYVPVDSLVKIVVPNVNYYNISAPSVSGGTLFSSQGTEYVYRVTGDFSFSVAYTAVTVDLTVVYDSKTGTVTPSGDSITDSDGIVTGTVTVNKNDAETVFTITPEEHYVLSKIDFNGTIYSNDTDSENKLPELNEGKYQFPITNSELDAETEYTLRFSFALDQYQVKYFSDDEDKGFVTASVGNKSDVEAFTQVTFTFEPANNQSKLIAVLLNGTYVSFDSIVYADGKYSLTTSIESDTEIKAIFDEVDNTTFAETAVNSLFDVTVSSENGRIFADPNNSESNDLVFYVNEAASVTLSLNREGVEAVVSDIKQNIQIDAIYNDDGTFDGIKNSYSVSINDSDNDNVVVLNSLQVVEFSDLFSLNIDTTYALPGSITFKFDTEAPSIENISKIDYTNEAKDINIEVTDDLSGVASVIVTNDYDDTEVTCSPNSDGVYEFTAPAREDYTGPVTYTVTATDNVGNSSAMEFTVDNDTEAPVLDDSNEEQPPIIFNNNEDNFFHRLLNAISFGKWGNDGITVDFAVKDNGTGYGEKSHVAIMLVPEGNTPDSDGNQIKYSADGVSSISLSPDEEPFSSANGTFKGTVYYKLTDDLGNTTKNWEMITSANSNIISDVSSENMSIIMIESIAPVISDAEITPVGSVTINNQIYAASGNVEFAINIADEDSAEDVDDNSGLYSYTVTDLNNKKVIQSKSIDEYSQETDTDLVTVLTTTLKPNDEGLFQFEVTVTDNAGNSTSKEFSIYQDLTSPVITDFKFDIEDYQDADGDAFNAVEVTDYGFYFKEDVVVTVSADDFKAVNEIASGLSNIEVYLVDVENADTQITPDDLIYDAASGMATFTIHSNFKGQIYARATDNVNNTPANSNLPADYSSTNSTADHYYPFNEDGYTHPSGTVVESLDKHSETSSIIITAPQASGTQNNAYSYTYDLNENAVADNELSYPDNSVQVPLYNSDPTFDIMVSDSYSGIRNVKWTVIEGGETRSESFEVPNALDANTTQINGWSIDSTDENLVTQMSGRITVTGNYNDMVLVVELTDRAGNVSYDYYTFGIDKTAPIITVSYNNNNADQRSGNTYFDADRTATIVVTERNFNSENVVINVTRDGRTYPVTLSWRNENGTETNGDGTRHITTITYDSDGDYTFSISYTDRAQNRNNGVNYGNSVASTAFTVDKTAPVISVSYNNNNAQNGHYFSSSRTATVVITEHNFDVNRVVFTRTAALNGSNITIPSVSWNNNGDVHTATIHYTADGDYTFNIAMDDMAGNTNSGVDYGASVAANEFTVDQTINAPVISFSDQEDGGVLDADKRSFNDIVRPIITVNDVNYGSVNVTLSRIVRNGTQDDLQSLLAIPNGNGSYTSENFPEEIENDGIYTITVTLTDQAGNTQTSDEVFTVNRFGSVYVFNDVLNAAVENNYNQSISGNVVITEYNADPISEEMIQVTKDGSPVSLDDNVISRTGNTRAEDGWYQNIYTIPQTAFAADGIYNIYISSADNSGNTPEMTEENIYYGENKLDGKDASFIIDATKPQIVNVYSEQAELSGNSINENLESLPINFEISDNIAIDTIEVYVGLGSTTPVETVNMDEYVENSEGNGNYTSYLGELTIDDGARNEEVYFIIKDKAGNEINTSSTNEDEATNFDMSAFEFLRNITVSTNPFVRWYANKPLFWGSIGALAAIVIGVFLIIFLKKRKKNDEENDEG